MPAFVGAIVSLYHRENDQRSKAYRIGMGEHPSDSAGLFAAWVSFGSVGSPAISALLDVEMLPQEKHPLLHCYPEWSLDRTVRSKQFSEAVMQAPLIEPTSESGRRTALDDPSVHPLVFIDAVRVEICKFRGRGPATQCAAAA